MSEILLATWNLELAPWNLERAPGRRDDLHYEVLAGIGADVVALQEVMDLVFAARLAGRLGMALYVAHANQVESDNEPGEPTPRLEHIVLLTRLPVRRAQFHPGDRTAMCRPVLEAWVDVPGVSHGLGVFAVHLRDRAGEPGTAFKTRETAALRTVLADAPWSHVVLGDFNAWMPGHAAAYGIADDWGLHLPEEHRRAYIHDTLAALLEDGYCDALANRTGDPPAPSQAPDRPRVDHVLVTPDLAPHVVDARILASETIDRASDHRPVVMRLALRS